MSAVSGALMLVIPKVMGITLWSPPLDRLNNSERGVQFCQELIKKYAFHRCNNFPQTTRNNKKTRFEFPSKVRRRWRPDPPHGPDPTEGHLSLGHADSGQREIFSFFG